VAEAEWHPPGGDVLLVTPVVRRLLRRRAVVTKAVGLDDEAQVGPVEVDAVVAQPDLGLRERKAGGAGEREEELLEPRLGEDERVAVEQPAQARDAGAPREGVQRFAQAFRVDPVAVVGFVHGFLELMPRNTHGEVDEGGDRAGHGDPVEAAALRHSCGPRVLRTDAGATV
jgi:hypothetical protein